MLTLYAYFDFRCCYFRCRAIRVTAMRYYATRLRYSTALRRAYAVTRVVYTLRLCCHAAAAAMLMICRLLTLLLPRCLMRVADYAAGVCEVGWCVAGMWWQQRWWGRVCQCGAVQGVWCGVVSHIFCHAAVTIRRDVTIDARYAI